MARDKFEVIANEASRGRADLVGGDDEKCAGSGLDRVVREGLGFGERLGANRGDDRDPPTDALHRHVDERVAFVEGEVGRRRGRGIREDAVAVVSDRVADQARVGVKADGSRVTGGNRVREARGFERHEISPLGPDPDGALDDPDPCL